METVEILIRLPKDLYKGIECRNGELETEYVCDKLMKAIDNGTVLPKGHDDLIERAQVTNYDNLYDVPTVIKADKENKE